MRDTMATEIKAVEDNNTWTSTKLPPSKTSIGWKWVYKVKFRADSTVERYKACLVVKGYIQTEGLDYNETFSPVANMVTIRSLLAICAIKQWHLCQFDVNNAFLHGNLEEEIYMKLPPGFSSCNSNHHVCEFNKSLYGLKQASWQWFSKFSTTIITMGSTKSSADYSVFIKRQDQSFLILVVYVDDIIVAGNHLEATSNLKDFLHRQLKLKDLGPLKYLLGLEVARTSQGISVCQPQIYAENPSRYWFTWFPYF